MTSDKPAAKTGKQLVRQKRKLQTDDIARLDEKAVQTVATTDEQTRGELLKEVAELSSGTRSVNLSTMLIQQVQTVQDQTHVCKPDDAFRSAIDGMICMKPKSYVEGMLAAQMIQTNYAIAEFMRRATHNEQMMDAVDRNVNRAVRLGRLFVEQTEALQKLRGQSGQQRVVVEHVTVESGGQAIVGAVAPGGGGRP